MAAQAAHPLLTDDTGTQGEGHWQLELNTDHTRSREADDSGWQRSVAGTLTHGMTETLDLAVGLPWWQLSGPGEVRERGVGDTTLQAKWRFYDDGAGWSLGLRPAITLPTGSSSRGLGNGRATAGVAWLSTLERGNWSWLVNAGYIWNANVHGDRKHLWSFSSALLYAVTPQWSLAADVGVARSADGTASTARYALVGAIWHVHKDLDLDLGWRRSLEGGAAAHTVGTGITVRW